MAVKSRRGTNSAALIGVVKALLDSRDGAGAVELWNMLQTKGILAGGRWSAEAPVINAVSQQRRRAASIPVASSTRITPKPLSDRMTYPSTWMAANRNLSTWCRKACTRGTG